MVKVRKYEEYDAAGVGILIADTYGGFNLAGFTPDKRDSMLGPFAHARSPEPQHREGIVAAIDAPSVLIAEGGGKILGVLRGGRTDHRGRTVLSSLFVDGRHHRHGIGRKLVERFEQECRARGVTVVKLSATMYAVGFYENLGYRRTTGVRPSSSFDEPGFTYQPMKRSLPPPD